MSEAPRIEIEGLRGTLVNVGLGQPIARGFCAAALVGVLAYCFQLPNGAFTEEGEMRPLKGLSKSPEATYAHFLAVPLGVGAAVSLFT